MNIKLLKKLHLYGTYKKFVLYRVNNTLAGTKEKNFEKKRKLLNSLDNFSLGEGTKVVGPLDVTGKLIVARNCWVGKNFSVYGNGTVTIGDNCDIAPDVSFITGDHQIGNTERRAGKGIINNISIGNGCWIGARTALYNNVGNSSIVGACAFVNKPIEDNVLVGGVPAKKIKDLV
ncbi:MAG: acyltransferase [Ruminococcaceae bacterium]|nr:acyltransferase [Oscillospiraceae bacterium]